jgi:hypothetical protein
VRAGAVAVATLAALTATAKASESAAQPVRLGSFDLATISGHLGDRRAGAGDAAAWAAHLEIGVVDLVGSAHLLTATLARPGGDTGLRWRLGGPRLDVIFVCRDSAGALTLAWPFGGLAALGGACARPAWFALGLAPFEAQIDARTGRALARVGALRAYLNPLVNAQPGDDAFLLRRLLVYAEGAFDWVMRPGEMIPVAGTRSAARVALGLDGRFISADHRWELGAAGAVGTNPAAFTGEVSATGQAQAALRFRVGSGLGRAGLELALDHHGVPDRAIGTFASTARTNAAYGGIFMATSIL